jgi:H+-transporting ATPase
VDQSALTGESLPVDKKTGDTAYSGSIAKQGEMLAQVTTTGGRTYFGRTAKLVGQAHTVSHFQRAVLTIGDYLIYLSLGLAAILVITRLIRGDSALTLVQFTLILVVAAIPVAMPAVLSVTMAIGALVLARMKAILARLEAIEEMAGMNVLCSDKTGTLTQNRLTLGEPEVFDAPDPGALILAASLASKQDAPDAIDAAVLGGLADPGALARYTCDRFVPFDPVHKRTEAAITGPDAKAFRVTKGAPQVILDLCRPDAGTTRRAGDRVAALAAGGYRTLGVARSDDGDAWRFLGLLPLFDPPREDSAETIAEARRHGIEVKMVTGDNAAIAREIGGQLGLGRNVSIASQLFGKEGSGRVSDRVAEQVEAADGFAEVFPEHKFEIVRALQARGHIVGMTGDGVNDAPALKQADIGIAVSGATDAARAAADLVLTERGLDVIVRAVEEARRIFERMNSYAIYRIAETIRIMFFVVLAMMIFNFYPITSVMIILLAVLNDLPILTIAYDNTWLAPRPVRWDMRRVLTVATVLGLVGVAETFLLLVIVQAWLAPSASVLQSLIYLKLAVAGHMTLFVARTRHAFWQRPYPAKRLLLAILGTQVAAALIVGFGILLPRIPWSYVGLVWGYCTIWIFIEDWAKREVYRCLDFCADRHVAFLSLIKQPLHRYANPR